MRPCWLLIFFFFAIRGSHLYSQPAAGNPIRFMFYNAENFFDTRDDPDKDDDEFLPAGVRRWSWSRYTRKKNSISKVILAAGDWEPPALIGLCEVENRGVLDDLVATTYLAKHNYAVIHEDSDDPRGIDVAILYRKDIITPLLSRNIIPEGYNRSTFLTRAVLYSKLLIENDTLHLFINHWPSRRGGTLSGESLRIKLAEMIRHYCDSISASNHSHSKIIIAGDFNSTPLDREIVLLSSRREGREGVQDIINLSAVITGEDRGTYRYMGIWETIDQILVSEDLIDSENGLFVKKDGFKIFCEDFLLKRDPKYPGETPLSTFYGYRYQGGFSDHLPVVIDLYYH
jgi:predicted extracellular nuclease